MASITVSGLPGTGTSTLCRILEQRTQMPYVYAGQIFREEAAKRAMSLAELNALCQTDSSIDRELDNRQLEYLRSGELILEGRLSGWLAFSHGLVALKVWVVCDVSERVRRLVLRDGLDAAVQAELMGQRVRRERDRYLRYYGADLDDTSYYDLVLDSTRSTPAELADAVLRVRDR